MATKFKTRSPFYLRRLSDEVIGRLKNESDKTSKAVWLIIEETLEKKYGIEPLLTLEEKYLSPRKYKEKRIGRPFRVKKYDKFD